MNQLETVAAELETHIRRHNRPGSCPSALRLRGLAFGRSEEAISDVPGQALDEDITMVATELAGAALERATDSGRPMRFVLEADGWPSLRLLVNPEAEVSRAPDRGGLAPRQASDDVTLAEDDGPAPFFGEHRGAVVVRAPPLSNQAAALTAFSLNAMRDLHELVARGAQSREESMRAELERAHADRRHLAEAHASAILAREQLLDRQAERQLEIDRVKQRDKWVQDGFAKIVSLVALHAPMVLDKFGMAVDPKAKEVLFDIVGSVAAAKPFVSAMRLASDAAQKNGSHSNGAPPPPPPTTAGALAASIISGGGESVGAAALAVFASVTVEFVNSVRDKLAMVKPLLDERAGTLLDKIIELTDAHGTTFQAVGRAALQGATQVTSASTRDSGQPSDSEERKLLRFVDLCGAFFSGLSPGDVDRIRPLVTGRARDALDEIRRDYDLSTLPGPAN